MGRFQIFQRVGKTRIIPISLKILSVFTCLLLLSNFATNFINIQLNQGQIIKLSNEVMVHQLKEIYTNAANQFAIYQFSGDENAAFDAVENSAKKGFTYPNSIAMGVTPEGNLLFCAYAASDSSLRTSYNEKATFTDKEILAKLETDRANGKTEGSIRFENAIGEYFGVYKYNEDWKCYCIRSELTDDTKKASNLVFLIISGIIVIITIAFLWIGLAMFNRILANVKKMTDSLYQMQNNQRLDLIDISDAPNDDVTYLGASFNSLSSTINNLLGIFQKFVSKDVVETAYKDHVIKLEGNQKELTILFSDIRGFTYMTETLGNEIINLLNIHYDRVIHTIHEENGIIGSIIGDAVLAVYGAMYSRNNKSLEALRTAWNITKVTAELRERMIQRRAELEKDKPLTEAEERIYKAVLLDVGVGIDGGTVFYGNIGSNERMTNTVIGDNVNSSSRLEGLTRIYQLPVIASEYVKDEVEKVTDQYKFFEIDTVQVKGKTEGKRIYLPLDVSITDEQTLAQYEIFELGLKAYYEGDWTEARHQFKKSEIDVAKIFLSRISVKQAPADWSGIWTMTTK